MRDCYAISKVFIAPMFIGTGLQNKLLEAMAMGIPCITTSLANKALGATPDKEILIANNADEFITQYKRLLEDSYFYTQLVKNGKEYVLLHFSWSQCNKTQTYL